ncbi:MAG: hypothetical protein FJY66_04945 [Calditrichaeota bacterium]|nr:hypothetical protein [Calditrichota bacterium]
MNNKAKRSLSYVLLVTWMLAIGLPVGQAAWDVVREALEGDSGCCCCKSSCCQIPVEHGNTACTCVAHLSFSTIGVLPSFSFQNPLCLSGHIVSSFSVPLQAPSFPIEHPPTVIAA